MTKLTITEVNRLAKLRDEGGIGECLEQCLAVLSANNECLLEPILLLKGLIGDCYFDLKRYEEALHIYDQIVVEKPSAIAFANRGYAKWSLRRLDDASKDFRSALRLDPNDAVITRNAAEIASEMGELRRAVVLARRACRLAPKHPHSYLVAAIVRDRQGKTAEACELLRKTLELDPANSQALRGLAKLGCDSKKRRQKGI